MNKFLTSAFFIASLAASAQNVSFVSNEVCAGLQTTLVADYSPGNSMVSQWLWDFDNDGLFDDGIGQTTNYLFPSDGSFQVALKVTLTAGGADSSAATAVSVAPTPQVNFQVDNLCAGASATYSNGSSISSGSIAQFLWDFDNDGNVDDNSGPVVSFTNGPPGSYVAKLECISDKGCVSFATKSTEVYANPVANFSGTNACLGSPVSFSNTSSISMGSINLNVWNFGDGSQEVSSGTVTHDYMSAQTYNVELVVVSDQLCADTVTSSVTVFDPPTVSITVTGDSVLYDGASTTLTAAGSVGTYLWTNSSGSQTWSTQSITVTTGGVYTLQVTDANGCMTSESQGIVVKVIDEPDVRNNVLSPNGDGINEVLFVEDINAYDACVITVYNIWGDVVYLNDGYKNEWSGQESGGRQLEGGSYYYVLQCDDKLVKKGNVNILR